MTAYAKRSGQVCLLTIQEDGPISADTAAEVIHNVFQQMSFKTSRKAQRSSLELTDAEIA
ncbi:hypothetical protein THAOC_37643, partial [Thalassiosira oceanica]